MILLPENLRARLIANGAAEVETDHIPVVKLFDPCSAATWLVTEMMADGDTLFGLADLGFGHPELGSFSLSEIESVKGVFGLGIERDIHFVGRFPLSVYAQAARRAGSIVKTEAVLRRFAVAIHLSTCATAGARPISPISCRPSASAAFSSRFWSVRTAIQTPSRSSPDGGAIRCKDDCR